MDVTIRLSGMVSLSNLCRMVQVMREKACSCSPELREGKGMILSLMQAGRRGNVPVLSTSIAGAKLKLGALEGGGELLKECNTASHRLTMH